MPRAQLDGGASVRLHRFFALRFQGGSAIDAGAIAAGSGTARPPGHAGWYAGAAPTFVLPLDHGRTQLAAGIDATIAAIPFVWDDSYECGTPDVPATCGGTSDEMWVAFLLGTSFSVSRWLADFVRVGGSLGMRIQPTLDSAFASSAQAPTGLGYVALALQAEVRFQIVDELALAIESQWVAPIGPYWLYPTIAVTIYGTFGESPSEDPRDPSTWISP